MGIIFLTTMFFRGESYCWASVSFEEPSQQEALSPLFSIIDAEFMSASNQGEAFYEQLKDQYDVLLRELEKAYLEFNSTEQDDLDSYGLNKVLEEAQILSSRWQRDFTEDFASLEISPPSFHIRDDRRSIQKDSDQLKSYLKLFARVTGELTHLLRQSSVYYQKFETSQGLGVYEKIRDSMRYSMVHDKPMIFKYHRKIDKKVSEEVKSSLKKIVRSLRQTIEASDQDHSFYYEATLSEICIFHFSWQKKKKLEQLKNQVHIDQETRKGKKEKRIKKLQSGFLSVLQGQDYHLETHEVAILKLKDQSQSADGVEKPTWMILTLTKEEVKKPLSSVVFCLLQSSMEAGYSYFSEVEAVASSSFTEFDKKALEVALDLKGASKLFDLKVLLSNSSLCELAISSPHSGNILQLTKEQGIREDELQSFTQIKNESEEDKKVSEESILCKTSFTPYIYRQYMAAAYTLFKLSRPDYSLQEGRDVGAILVSASGEILCWAVNTVGEHSSSRTKHAEINLLQAYFENHPEETTLPKGSRVFTTLKPCHMCSSALCSTKDPSFDKVFVYYGQKDPTQVGTILEKKQWEAPLDGIEGPPSLRTAYCGRSSMYQAITDHGQSLKDTKGYNAAMGQQELGDEHKMATDYLSRTISRRRQSSETPFTKLLNLIEKFFLFHGLDLLSPA